MLDSLYQVLSEKLGDATVTVEGEEKKVLDVVSDWEDYNGKLKAANEDLTSQRDQWDEKRKELNAKVEELEKANKDLDTQLKGNDKNTKKASQEVQELQKQINTLTDKLETEAAEREKISKQYAESQEKSRNASRRAEEQALRNDILAELGKHKITGDQAEVALNDITARGYAKVLDGDNGEFNRSFTITKDGKELSSDLGNICKTIATEKPFLVSGSGKAGTGQDHESHKGGGSGTRPSYLSMIQN